MLDLIIHKIISFVEDVSNSILKKMSILINKAFDSNQYKLYMLIILFGLIVIGFYSLNVHTTYVADDFYFAYNFATGMRIVTLADLVDAVIQHYFLWSGRLGDGVYPFLFMMYDKSVFDFANTIMFIVMLSGIYFFAIGGKGFHPAVLLIISSVIFLFSPAFGQFFLWITGAGVYLWSIGPAIWFLLIYKIQLEKSEDMVLPNYLLVMFTLLSFYVGCANDLIGCSAIASVFVACGIRYNDKKALPKWMLASLFSCILGFIFLLSAPGNYVRLAGAGTDYSIVKNFFFITRWLWSPDVLLYPVAMVVILVLLPKKEINLKVCSILLIAIATSMYAMTVVPYTAGRVKVVPIIYMTMLIAYLYTKLDFTINKIKYALVMCFVVMVVQLEYTYHDAYEAIVNFEEIEQANVEHIIDKREEGILNTEIKRNIPSSSYCAGWHTAGIEVDGWASTGYTDYYGMESIKIVE